jgi:hypothetical protein
MKIEIDGIECEARLATGSYVDGAVSIYCDGFVVATHRDLEDAIVLARRVLRDAKATPKNRETA